VREAANRDAERTREEALEKARAQVAAVAQVSTTLLERVGSMDAEVSALVSSLRSGAGRLAADLAAVEAGMGELYGAASGATYTPAQPQAAPAARPQAAPAVQPQATPTPEHEALPSPVPTPAGRFESELSSAMAAPLSAAGEPELEVAGSGGDQASADADLDGARLIALNMALNGESRAETERYLAENFRLPDRLKLVDEVYAAIEG
jgi:hypothetical protein